MLRQLVLVLATSLTCASSLAAHIVTDTRAGDVLLKRTHTYANGAGDLRIDEHGYDAGAVSMSAAASAGSQIETDYTVGDLEDTTIYQSRGEAIVILEGETCRKMTADSAPPPGLGHMGNMGDMNKQMAEAMKKASSAMEEAMKQARKEGMTAEQERAMKQYTQPFLDAPSAKPRGALEIQKLDQRVTVGRYTGEGYLVVDQDGTEKHRIWLTPTRKISGARDVRNAMQGMMDTYEAYLDKMGGGALMDTGLTAVFNKKELADMYPIRIEDIDSGEVTDVVEVHSGDGGTDFYPDCEVKDMFGM